MNGVTFKQTFVAAVCGVMLCGVLPAMPHSEKFETLGEAENAASLAITPAASPRSEELVSLSEGPNVWRADEPPTSGGLWGKKIALEIAHGRTWRNTDWRWQREDWFQGRHVHSSQEDFNSARIVNRWLLPYLRNAGAELYPNRCTDEQVNEVIVDAVLEPPQSGNGNWTTQPSSNFVGGSFIYTFSEASTSATATLQLRADIAESGYYGVTVKYPGFPDQCNDVIMTVIDGAGNRHDFIVDQSRNRNEWVTLDKFYFEAGSSVPVFEFSNLCSQPDKSITIDAVRLGGGMGTEDFGGGPSGVPRWQETATCWIKYNGAPSNVWQSSLGEPHDTYARYSYARYKNADLMLGLHTNGSVYHTGFGSEVFQYSPDTSLLPLLSYIYPKIVQSLRKHYRTAWTDRGVKANDSTGWPFQIVLVELAFHDWLTDAQALMDEDFRKVAMRGFYEGTVDYFTNKTGVYLPEPPEQLSLKNLGGGTVRAEWTSSSIGTAPESYRVYYSTHPHCFKDYVETSAPATTVNVGPLAPGQVFYFQFRSWNQGGLSLPSETLAAMPSADLDARRALVVNGFDRFDWDIDLTDNHRNYIKEHAVAIADAATSLGIALSIDSASNEAVASGKHGLTGYAVVDWILGQESAADETFSGEEQLAVSNYKSGRGVLMVSGTDVASDLGTSGTLEDQSFLLDALGALPPPSRLLTVTGFAGETGSVFDGLSLAADETTASYSLLGADALAPGAGASAALVIGSTNLGLQMIAQPNPSFLLSVPFEDIAGADNRRAIMERVLPLSPNGSGVGEWSIY